MSGTADDAAIKATLARIARIDRRQEETEQFAAEQHTLMAAQARKFDRERWIVPVLVVVGGILAAVIARLPEILHAFGVG